MWNYSVLKLRYWNQTRIMFMGETWIFSFFLRPYCTVVAFGQELLFGCFGLGQRVINRQSKARSAKLCPCYCALMGPALKWQIDSANQIVHRSGVAFLNLLFREAKLCILLWWGADRVIGIALENWCSLKISSILLMLFQTSLVGLLSILLKFSHKCDCVN
jgi:hypothetical protein